MAAAAPRDLWIPRFRELPADDVYGVSRVAALYGAEAAAALGAPAPWWSSQTSQRPQTCFDTFPAHSAACRNPPPAAAGAAEPAEEAPPPPPPPAADDDSAMPGADGDDTSDEVYARLHESTFARMRDIVAAAHERVAQANKRKTPCASPRQRASSSTSLAAAAATASMLSTTPPSSSPAAATAPPIVAAPAIEGSSGDTGTLDACDEASPRKRARVQQAEA